MKLPKANLNFTENRKKAETYNDVIYDLFENFELKIQIEDKLIQPGGGKYFNYNEKGKNGSRYCVKYKNLFYKIEYWDDDPTGKFTQNLTEWKNYSKIDKSDKKYFSTILEHHIDSIVIGDDVVYYSYIVHKYDKIYNQQFKKKDVEIMRNMIDKYNIDDINVIDPHNCGYRKLENKLQPFIFDIGSENF